jgi:hypothetical protein
MPIGYIFWLLMILWAFGFWGIGWGGWGGARGPLWAGFMLWLLLFFLGWHDFGFVLQGGMGR